MGFFILKVKSALLIRHPLFIFVTKAFYWTLNIDYPSLKAFYLNDWQLTNFLNFLMLDYFVTKCIEYLTWNYLLIDL